MMSNFGHFLTTHERRRMNRRPQAYPMPAHHEMLHNRIKPFVTSLIHFSIGWQRAATTNPGEKPNSLAAHGHRPVIFPVARTMVKDG
jgi:hypothetical protein